MSWLKHLSLVLIIGCLAVYAAETEKTEKTEVTEKTQNASDDTPRVMDENDVRLLLKPFFVQQTTPKPQTIIVKPAYHHYPHDYHHNYHDDDDYYHHYRPSYHRPSYHHPPPRPHPPVYPPPHHPPIYPPYYPPHSSYGYGGYGGYGYGGYGYGGRRPRPVIVVIRPPAGRPDDDIPDVTTETDENRFRYFYRSPLNPAYPEDQVEPEVLEGEYEEEMGRSIKVDGLTMKADNDDDTESIAVDTKDIKLPFGLHLSSHPRYGKKVNDQEALIYLRNYKNGRKLKVTEVAGN